MATENPILKRNRERAAKLKRQRKKPLSQLVTAHAKGAEKLRIAKKFLRGKELTTSDEKILDTILNKLGKKYGKKEGYQSMTTLQDWVDDKKGMRSKSLQQAREKAEPPSKKRAKMGDKDIPTPKGSTPAFRAGEWEPTLFGKKKVKWDAGELRQNKQIEYLENKIKTVLKPGSKTSHAMRGRLERAQKKLEDLKKKHGVVAEPPAVAATAKPVPVGSGKKVTIRQDDTLSDLAKKEGTTLAAIRKANPGRFPTAASLNKIKTGEKINMPPGTGAKTPYDVPIVSVKPKKRKATVTGIESPSHRSPVETKTSPVRGVESPSHRSPVKKDKVKSSLSDPKFSGGVATGVRPPLKPLEGGVRYKKLPDWLGGGEIKIDSSDEAFDYENSDNVTHGKKGGQVKKGVKKIKARKAKPRKRAALRGHRAELRGG